MRMALSAGLIFAILLISGCIDYEIGRGENPPIDNYLPSSGYTDYGNTNGSNVNNEQPVNDNIDISERSTGNVELDAYLTDLIQIKENVQRLDSDFFSKVDDLKNGTLEDEVFCDAFNEIRQQIFSSQQSLNNLEIMVVGDTYVDELIGNLTGDIKGSHDWLINKHFGVVENFCEDKTALNKAEIGSYGSYSTSTWFDKWLNELYDYYDLKDKPRQEYTIKDKIITNGFEVELSIVKRNAFDMYRSRPKQTKDISNPEYEEINSYFKAIRNANEEGSDIIYEELINELDQKYGEHIIRFFEVWCEYEKVENLDTRISGYIYSRACILDTKNKKGYAPINMGTMAKPVTTKWFTWDYFNNEISQIDYAVYILCSIDEPGVCSSDTFANKAISYYENHSDVAVFKIIPSEMPMEVH